MVFKHYTRDAHLHTHTQKIPVIQKCRCQVTAKHAYTLRMWILLNRASALVTTCP